MRDESDRKLPVPTSGKRDASNVLAPTPQHTGGVVDTWLTGWRAKQKTAVHKELAALNRAKADEIGAYGELAESYERTARIVRSVDDLPDTLALDAAKARAGRETDYAELDERRDERAHQGDLTKLRRERELQEARRGLVEENRGLFNAEQGLENQQRLKDRNLRIWQKRHAAKELDVDIETDRVRSELRGGDTPAEKPGSVERMREKAETALIEALADGNDAEAERWQQVLDALGE